MPLGGANSAAFQAAHALRNAREAEDLACQERSAPPEPRRRPRVIDPGSEAALAAVAVVISCKLGATESKIDSAG
jgi:hypothetical protein